MRVAVLGSGIQGSCVALELTRRGCRVDLYDKADQPITQASLYNEGKIHLGFVYSRDRHQRTVETMLRGSLRFASLLSGWVDASPDALTPSSEFVYGVHRDSMTTSEHIDGHFERVQTTYDGMRDIGNVEYLGRTPRRLFERMSPRQLAEIFDDAHVIAGYRTVERAVAPARVAELLRQAIAADSRIQFVGNTHINGASIAEDGRVRVAFTHAGGDEQVTYPSVVNALWAGRLAIDRAVGALPARPWLNRFKLAVQLTLATIVDAIPSATFVLGPFGDIVNFAGAQIYLSWYPCCMIGASTAIDPPDLIDTVDQLTVDRIVGDTIGALTTLCPTLALAAGRIVRTEVGGGAIFAWGATDIDDPDSELHSRFDVGVQSVGRYHSVNTGKYCLAPLFAVTVADRIIPSRGRFPSCARPR